MSNTTLRLLLLAGFIAIVVGILLANAPDEETLAEREAERERETEESVERTLDMRDEGKHPTETRYVHSTVNVRAEPTTDSDIIEELGRGADVTVMADSLENEWVPVRRDREVYGYVYADLLEDGPLPDTEIVDFTWRSDPSFGTDGTIRWVVEVRNNTNRYVDAVRVRFSTYDAQDNIISSTFAYVNNITPGGTSSNESFADYYGTEEGGRARIEETRYSR